MDICFKNSKIRTICTSKNKAITKYGKSNADRLFLRLTHITVADNLELLKTFPGRYHQLTGNRDGQWACTIQGGLRLIFEPMGDGSILLSEITEVTIVDIVDYH